MATIRVQYLPDEPSQYLIEWKRITDMGFTIANSMKVTKTSDALQTQNITVADALTDWIVRVTSICSVVPGSSRGPGRIVRVLAANTPVTYTLSHCICVPYVPTP